MSDEAKIKITVSDEAAIKSVSDLGKSFAVVSKEAEKASSNLKSVSSSAKKGSEVTGEFGQKLKEMAKGMAFGVVSVEAVKRLYSFADATMKNIDNIKGVTTANREAAKSYNELMTQASDNMQTVVGNLAGLMLTLGEAAKNASWLWKKIVGGDKESTMDDMVELSKKLNNKTIAINANNGVIKELQDKYDKEQNSIAKQYIADSLKKNKEYNAQLVKEKEALNAELAKLNKEYASQSAMDSEIDKRSKLSKNGISSGSVSKSTGSQRTFDFDDRKKQKSDYLDWLADLQDQEVSAEQQLLADHKRIQDEKADYDKKIAKDIAETEASYREKARLESIAKAQAELQVYSGFANSMVAIITEMGGKNKEATIAALDLSELVAAANIAEGVTKALAQGGILGLATGATVAAAGATQIIQIEKQKSEVAGYEKGGLIKGDNVLIRANENGKEFVATASSTNSYFPALQAMNAGASRQEVANLVMGGNGGGIVVNYSPTYPSGTNDMMIRRGHNDLMRQVKKVMNDRTFNRSQAAI